ncbi:MAG: hypothetical protein HFF61_02560 [Oscillospiraceae bacterium]|nr:hypothetical protein [Oscillospiraceae bacterium]
MNEEEKLYETEAAEDAVLEDDIDLLLARYGIVVSEEDLALPELFPPAVEPEEERLEPVKPPIFAEASVEPAVPVEAESEETPAEEAPPPPVRRRRRKVSPKVEAERSVEPEVEVPSQAEEEAPRQEEAEPVRPAEEAAEDVEPLFAMEDVVASTVESVLEERRDEERRYQRQYRRTRRKQEKLHKSKASRAADPEEIEEEEPSLIEAAVVQKRRYQRLRRRAVLATALTLLYWAPLALSAAGIKVPYYSEDVRVFVWASAAVQGLVCLLGLPVFMEGFGRMQINCHTCVALSGLLTLADTVSVLFLEGRMEASPLGGIAAVSMCLSLWGECWRAGALREGFRLAAIGDPAYVVDLTESGAVKRRGRCGGFYSRSVKEDTASKWQRVLLPLVIVGSAVFAVLCSYGLERPRHFLWCWSAILTAGTALALPCVYSMPYSALAKRLGKSGCAVAGFYGAHQLSFSRELLVGDEDLFPPGSIRLKEVKVIREDERKAASYAGSLAAAYRCGWTNLLMGHLTDAGGQLEHLDHFHVHEEGGVSASIYGETAVLGTANLIRKLSIRLPKSMEWKDGLYLSIDGEVCAIFCLVYQMQDGVRWSLGALRRNALTPHLATRDPNLTPKFLKSCSASDGGAVLLDLNDRLNLSDPDQSGRARPNALIYREGLAPFLEVVAGSKRLCRAVSAGNAIALLGSLAGTLLSYYLIFVGSMSAFYPPQLLLFMGLWLLPVVLLSYNVDKI